MMEGLEARGRHLDLIEQRALTPSLSVWKTLCRSYSIVQPRGSILRFLHVEGERVLVLVPLRYQTTLYCHFCSLNS